ncbi:hypothetical protein [Dactylosporangium sp. NPDC005555]
MAQWGADKICSSCYRWAKSKLGGADAPPSLGMGNMQEGSWDAVK